MKGVSKSKFLLCLRPVVQPDHLEGRGPSVGRAITYIGATEPGDGCSAEPVTGTQKRTLPRAVRAVLYQIILSKRIRNNKGLRSPNLTNSLSGEGSSSPSSSYVSDENKREALENQGTKPNSASGSTKQPKSFSMKSTAAKQSFLDSGALLFLMSLAITVLWGKLCATLFTSIWLYFLSHPRGVSGNRPNHLPAETRLNESKPGGSYNKKRVIMEGMLERNHRRAET